MLMHVHRVAPGRVRASPKWLLNKPIGVKPSYMGRIGSIIPGNEGRLVVCAEGIPCLRRVDCLASAAVSLLSYCFDLALP